MVNPEGPLTQAKVYIDNSVSGYDTSTESLYYTIYYADGSVSGPTLVEEDDLSNEPGRQKSFIIDGGGAIMDAFQLTMGSGTIKIPVIEFKFTEELVVDPLYFNLTATVTDGDGAN